VKIIGNSGEFGLPIEQEEIEKRRKLGISEYQITIICGDNEHATWSGEEVWAVLQYKPVGGETLEDLYIREADRAIAYYERVLKGREERRAILPYQKREIERAICELSCFRNFIYDCTYYDEEGYVNNDINSVV